MSDVFEFGMLSGVELRRVSSTAAKAEYDILISLPASYGDGDKTYPVLIVLDPSYCYGGAVETARLQAATNEAVELIVVGVATPGGPAAHNLRRLRDYTPGAPNPLIDLLKDRLESAGLTVEDAFGGSRAFTRFLVDELLPSLRAEYRIGEVGLVGHSCGGVFAADLLLNDEPFDKLIIGSFGLNWYEPEALLRLEQAFAARLAPKTRVAVIPAFDRFIAFLDDEYKNHCRDEIGMSQYPNGREIYEQLVRAHTTLGLTPEEVHEKGLARIAGLWRQTEAELASLGFAGTPKEFVQAATADPAWRADTPESIGAVFQRYIDLMAPKLDVTFHQQQVAPYRAEPLPDSLSGSMTYGYYDTPSEGITYGRYLFNVPRLKETHLCSVAHLTYHELSPGHHLHLARQREAKHLHPLRKIAVCNAYNEGWAEYAATLAGELGGYPTAHERIGRIIWDIFLNSRLVVDTGMNALGWSLEAAREYLREFTFMPNGEIESETIRYACGIPGQCLAYKLGDTEILRLRDEMRVRLQGRFDVRDFHEAVLAPGALPLAILEEHVRHETERLANLAI